MTDTLLDLVSERERIDQFIAEHEGELTPEVEALLRTNDTATKEKVEAIAYFLDCEADRLKGIDAQIKRLQARKKAITERGEWLREHYLREAMYRLGYGVGQPLKGTLCTVRIQLNNPRLDGQVAEDTLISWLQDPARTGFVRYTPELFELDKVAFLAAAKLDPALLPDGMAIVRDESVRIA